MRAIVYHNTNNNAMFTAEPADYDVLDYREVAKVELKYEMKIEVFLEKVFMMTNSIDSYWGDNEGVFCDGEYRSLSVGDVIHVLGHGKYMVAGCGFIALSRA